MKNNIYLKSGYMYTTINISSEELLFDYIIPLDVISTKNKQYE